MLGHYGIIKDKPFVILKNSYNDKSLKSEHLLNVPHGEQAWINKTPFFYHYGRGSGRADNLYLIWMKAAAKYLQMDYESIIL